MLAVSRFSSSFARIVLALASVRFLYPAYAGSVSESIKEKRWEMCEIGNEMALTAALTRLVLATDVFLADRIQSLVAGF